mgnify:CR=1 FL=1
MKLKKYVLLGLACTLLGITNLNAQTKDFDFSKLENKIFDTTLDNGLKLIICPNHDAPVVSMTTWANVGGSDDPKGYSGLAHMFEHMAFKGTTTIGVTDYAKEIVKIAKEDALNDAIREERSKGLLCDNKKMEQLQNELSKAINKFHKYMPEYKDLIIDVQKSKADEFIARFARIYTPIVVILAILTLVIGGAVATLTKAPNPWMTWVHTGLEILVIGCPCAIVISVPLAYFSAIGLCSKHGIVVKGGSYLDKLSNMGKLITDKTGTLTHGSFTIQNIHCNECSEKELLYYVLPIESLSNHPIGKAIIHDYKKSKKASVKNFLEIPGLGCSGIVEGKEVLVGNDKMMLDHKVSYKSCTDNGSIVYVAINKEYKGYILLSDTIKDDAQPMVDLLHSKGVEMILLTGDKEENAKEICLKLGIDRWHSELLPEQKTDILEDEMRDYDKSVAFIGDGINDAPSIIRSDIGIAMGGIGSDVAVENADVIIMNDDPAKVYDALHIARMGRRTSIFNIVFALSVKLAVFVLALVFHNENFMMYVAIAADTGLTVLLVLNSLLLLYRPVKRKMQ